MSEDAEVKPERRKRYIDCGELTAFTIRPGRPGELAPKPAAATAAEANGTAKRLFIHGCFQSLGAIRLRFVGYD